MLWTFCYLSIMLSMTRDKTIISGMTNLFLFFCILIENLFFRLVVAYASALRHYLTGRHAFGDFVAFLDALLFFGVSIVLDIVAGVKRTLWMSSGAALRVRGNAEANSMLMRYLFDCKHVLLNVNLPFSTPVRRKTSLQC